MNTVCWLPLLTDHVSYTLNEYQVVTDGDVSVYVTMLDEPKRLAQGWYTKGANELDANLIPEAGWIRYCIGHMRSNRDSVHLFLSPFYNIKTIIILAAALILKLRISIISEPYITQSYGYLDDNNYVLNSIKAKIRPILYRIYGVFIKNRVENVFAISSLACRQYLEMGVNPNRIFPFGYFVPQLVGITNNIKQNKTFNIVFVGSLISIKGIYELIAAVKKLLSVGILIKLEVYGPGDSGQFEFDDNIKYSGIIPFGESQYVISKFDALVLPSHYDGWGVVVNESIQAGVPVICSNHVGAGGFVGKWGCGMVYDSNVSESLYSVLYYLSCNPEDLSLMRKAAINYQEKLDPKVAAVYLESIIQGDTNQNNTLSNPWY